MRDDLEWADLPEPGDPALAEWLEGTGPRYFIRHAELDMHPLGRVLRSWRRREGRCPAG